MNEFVDGSESRCLCLIQEDYFNKPLELREVLLLRSGKRTSYRH